MHNVAVCGDSKEKKWMQPKVPPHSQGACRERDSLGNTGSWGYALQTCSQPAGEICLQTGGIAAKDPKAEMSEQPGSSVQLSLTSESLSASPVSSQHHSLPLITPPRAALSSVLGPSMLFLLHLPLQLFHSPSVRQHGCFFCCKFILSSTL